MRKQSEEDCNHLMEELALEPDLIGCKKKIMRNNIYSIKHF
jgi:hypothetical protein